MTGTTDFAEIAVENPPSQAHRLAFDVLVDRLLGYIGNYHLKLDGRVDALVFAGGIGEKSALLRQTLSSKCQSLGVSIDPDENAKGPTNSETVKDISQGPGKGARVLICQTDEQVSSHKQALVEICLLRSAILPLSSRWHITVFARDSKFEHLICGRRGHLKSEVRPYIFCMLV